MKTALVSGGSGFVARHMIPVLRRRYQVTTFDIKNGHHEDARDWFRYSDTTYDLVVHLAAVVGGRQKIEGAPLDLAVDLAIDAEMFAWATRLRPGKVVYFSSSAAYPIELQTGIDMYRLKESDIDLDNIASPDLVYGWTKLTGEMLARHATDNGLEVLVVRPFSGYGSDQDLDYPFPAFIRRAREREDPFVIWGDGTQQRDFIHIQDVAEAVMAAVDRDVAGPINLCTGEATSFNDLANLVCKAAGYSPEFVHKTDAPRGVQSRIGDPTRLLKFYVPQIPLSEGIDQALWKR